MQSPALLLPGDVTDIGQPTHPEPRFLLCKITLSPWRGAAVESRREQCGDGVGTEPGPGERPGWQQVLASKGLKCRLQVRKGRHRKVKVQDWEPGRK